MSLKVFQGFQLEMAAEFTGMRSAQINTLKRNGIVKPEKTKEGYCYSFTDVLMIRLCKQLLDNGVRLGKLYKAHQYLTELDPEKRLTNVRLAVRIDTGDILWLGEDLKTVSISDFGQLILRGTVSVLPVGKQLEKVRREVLELDKRLDVGYRAKRTVSLEAMKRRYGIA